MNVLDRWAWMGKHFIYNRNTCCPRPISCFCNTKDALYSTVMLMVSTHNNIHPMLYLPDKCQWNHIVRVDYDEPVTVLAVWIWVRVVGWQNKAWRVCQISTAWSCENTWHMQSAFVHSTMWIVRPIILNPHISSIYKREILGCSRSQDTKTNTTHRTISIQSSTNWTPCLWTVLINQSKLHTLP